MAKNGSGAAADPDLGLRALAHVAADPDLATALIEAAGLAPGELARIAQGPDFTIFILDFLLASDDRAVAFAAAEGTRPEALMRLRASLAGPEDWG